LKYGFPRVFFPHLVKDYFEGVILNIVPLEKKMNDCDSMYLDFDAGFMLEVKVGFGFFSSVTSTKTKEFTLHGTNSFLCFADNCVELPKLIYYDKRLNKNGAC
jgi:hypothetical protein